MTSLKQLTTAGAAVLCLAAPAAAQAAPPTFKATVYIHQSAEWQASWQTPEICGDGYRHWFAGDGSGSSTYEAKNVLVTFKRKRGIWTTNAFAMKGQMGRSAGYDVGESGDPDGCAPGWAHAPEPPDTSECGFKKISRSSKSVWLTVVGGRLAPFGALTGPDGGDPYGGACPEQTGRSALVDSTPSPQRRDVDKLITDKRVRSIELSSGKGYIERPIGTEELLFPGGVDWAGSGDYEGRWTIKLVRVRR